jgi:GT2 family glycosyltransferase
MENYANPSQSLRASAPAPSVSIVLVSWNSRVDLIPCLRTLFESPLSVPFEVIVVDNNSSDKTPEIVEREFPSAIVIRRTENSGFAAACNEGVRAARGEFVLLLNNDTIPDADSLDRLAAFMRESPACAAAGGRLLNADRSFQAGYAKFSTLVQELILALHIGDRLSPGFPLHLDAKKITQADWLCAACLLVRRSAYLAVGGMDEQFFMYSEEVDLQWRLKRAGWAVYYIPDSETIHYGGRSQDRWRRRIMVYRGKILFYRKNYSPLRTVVLRCLFATVSAAKLLLWAAVRLLRPGSERPQKELRSNLEVIRLCLNPV